MSKLVYKYQFGDAVSMEAVESDLTLAVIAAESLFGSARVFLECGFLLDKEKRALVIEGGAEVGDAMNKIFVGLVHRFIGEGTFSVDRIDSDPTRRRRKKRKRGRRG